MGNDTNQSDNSYPIAENKTSNYVSENNDAPTRSTLEDAECFLCHEMGHLKRDCPQKSSGPRSGLDSSQCENCGKYGHSASQCRVLKDDEPSRSLLIKNLNNRTTVRDLGELCTPFGELLDVYIPRQHRTGEPHPYGFVEFVDQNSVHDALKTLNGSELLGNQLSCQIARTKRKEPFHGGQGRGNRNRGSYEGRYKHRDTGRRDDNDRRSSRHREDHFEKDEGSGFRHDYVSRDHRRYSGRGSYDDGRSRDRDDGRNRDRDDGRNRDRDEGRNRDRDEGRNRDRDEGRNRDHDEGRNRDRDEGQNRDRDEGHNRSDDRPRDRDSRDSKYHDPISQGNTRSCKNDEYSGRDSARERRRSLSRSPQRR